ncbi:hypothetical protein [Prevotella sp.]|uniref:hypothetical protein n=1 Tax=Prevotella sp. TaxID=59823 RepID=UPI0025EC15C8|nr:hypothetical protein [Prevotella sp.]
MENQLTRTTCLSIYTDSKQDRCRRSLLRLATFVILFLCSMTISWAQGTTILKDAISPTITLNSDKTTTSKLSFTITVSAKNEEQEGTSLVTYYTTDGSDPEDSSNKNRKELKGKSEVTVTENWKSGDKVKVRAFTKRVDDNDATNYDESKETTQDFHNTGSADLPCVDDPVITPGDQTVVAGSLDVTISHDQWKEATKDKLQIFYIKSERDGNGNTIQGNLTKASELPLTLTLKSSGTVKAYAVFTNNGNDEVKYDVVSRTYILLDDATTYLNKDDTKAVGTIVEKNGMTMTYGGIADGTNKFTKFTNVDYSEDNILGSLHAVTSTTLYLNKDAMSEKSDKEEYYSHKVASSQKLHERTFGLPAKGSFYKFEPEANGSLTVFVEQQGAMVKSQGKLDNTKVRKRPVYFLDETGKSIKADYAYTSSKINKADWKKIQEKTFDGIDALLKDYYQNIIDGKNDKFTNINSAVAEADKHNALTLGTSIQPVIELHDECNADILEGDDTYDNTGYMTISEGYVTYRFSVKAGKTYYLFASGTKLALSGFKFKQDAGSAENVTLYGNADNASTINGLTEDNQYNVTLNRSFGANKWYAVVLPFSVSQKQMKSVFGEGVSVLHYNNVTGTTLNLTEHYYQMIVGGTPVFVKPSKGVDNPTFDNVTLTSKDVVDIENSGFKCTGSWDNEDFPEYSYFINAKDNKFYLYDPTQVAAGTKPHAGAFRAWIISTSPNPAAAAQLNMRINGIEDNDETTAIWNAISADDDNAEVGSKDIYSLSGQKMNTTDTRSLPKGIYIVNGKKFIVK